MGGVLLGELFNNSCLMLLDKSIISYKYYFLIKQLPTESSTKPWRGEWMGGWGDTLLPAAVLGNEAALTPLSSRGGT